jgi:hypothetical protein
MAHIVCATIRGRIVITEKRMRSLWQGLLATNVIGLLRKMQADAPFFSARPKYFKPGPQFGAADAMLSVMPLSGAAPFSCLWSPGGSTSANLKGIPAGAYTLTLTDERGCEAVQVFEVKYVLSAGELPESRLLLYPNPAGDRVRVRTEAGPGALLVPLEIYDSGGRLLRPAPVPNPGAAVWEVSLEGLAAGWYPIRLPDGTGKVAASGELIKH